MLISLKIDFLLMKGIFGLFCVAIAVVFAISIYFSSAGITGAVQGNSPTSRVVTTYLGEPNQSIFEQSERIWEISQSSIDLGKTLELKKNDLIKMIIRAENYYIYVNEISNEEIRLVTLGNQTIILKQNESKIFEITDKYTNEKKILELRLDSVEGETARMHIKTYDRDISIQADYKELFDIEVELPEEEIYDASELIVYINFYNFGEGPSHINIEYAILDDSGKEHYRGVDDKVVYTTDSLIKEFDFLKLPQGNYTITSEIFYGKNQTAFSEKNFRILPSSTFKKLKPLIVLGLILATFMFFIYRMKFGQKKYDKDKARTLKPLRI